MELRPRALAFFMIVGAAGALLWTQRMALFGIAHAGTLMRPNTQVPEGCLKNVAEILTKHPSFKRPDGLRDPYLVVSKAERRIQLFSGDEPLAKGSGAHCYPIALAYVPLAGPKRKQGDLKTPEGWYRTSDKPWSRFPHAIAVHYPNAQDASRGVAHKLITEEARARIERALQQDRKPPQTTALGGEILIHGDGGTTDWTLGCVGMENPDIQSLRRALPEGMRSWVVILP